MASRSEEAAEPARSKPGEPRAGQDPPGAAVTFGATSPKPTETSAPAAPLAFGGRGDETRPLAGRQQSRGAEARKHRVGRPSGARCSVLLPPACSRRDGSCGCGPVPRPEGSRARGLTAAGRPGPPSWACPAEDGRSVRPWGERARSAALASRCGERKPGTAGQRADQRSTLPGPGATRPPPPARRRHRHQGARPRRSSACGRGRRRAMTSASARRREDARL